jgi:quercetin dioxygenase-like cupin family protein
MEVILEPGETTAEEPLAHRGEEVVIVTKGRVEVEYGDEKYWLDDGDSIYLVSSVPHKFTNVSRGQSRLIMSILNQFPRMSAESTRVYVKSGGQAS